MKFFILSMTLLTLSLSAQASYVCKIQTLKTIIGNRAILIPNHKVEYDFDSDDREINELSNIRLATIESEANPSHRYVYILDTVSACPSRQCGVRGIIHKLYVKVQADGTEVMEGFNTDVSNFGIFGKDKKDIIISEEGKQKTVRISCK